MLHEKKTHLSVSLLLFSSFGLACRIAQATDCNANGVLDAQDIANCDESAWCSDCNGNGVLDECDLDTAQWVQRQPIHSPSERHNTVAVYDAARHQTVLFGGFRHSGIWFGDTWAWNGSDWTDLFVPGHDGRNGHGMAYDTHREKIVLFGGTKGPPEHWVNETWEWDGIAWTQAQPLVRPARRSAVLAFDEARHETLLFGGYSPDPASVLADTWGWNGIEWHQRATEGPSARGWQAMAYDAARQEVVLFGGSNGLGSSPSEEQVFADTWIWNGSTWIQKQPAQSPPARLQASMVYDSHRRTVILFGGAYAGPGPAWLNDTWEWDGETWSPIETGASAPTARDIFAMAYDSDRDVTVVFSGRSSSSEFLGDTWEFQWESADCDSNGSPDECDSDSDVDGYIDGCDGCPFDPLKIAPGICGCAMPDSDSDSDGTPNCFDGCPNDGGKITPGVCGCGTPDADTDVDLLADCVDNCPRERNIDQADRDHDHIGDACDDSDGDGLVDASDHCPTSIISATIVIDGCNTGVSNLLLAEGCTTSDLISQCAANATNHGSFVSCVTHLATQWRQAGWITNNQRSRIVSCAAQARIP